MDWRSELLLLILIGLLVYAAGHLHDKIQGLIL